MAYTFTGVYEFPLKKFYWALSADYQFQEMPDLNDQHKEAVDKESSLFEGNPKKKLVSVQKEGDEEEAAEEQPADEEDEEKN